MSCRAYRGLHVVSCVSSPAYRVVRIVIVYRVVRIVSCMSCRAYRLLRIVLCVSCRAYHVRVVAYHIVSYNVI